MEFDLFGTKRRRREQAEREADGAKRLAEAMAKSAAVQLQLGITVQMLKIQSSLHRARQEREYREAERQAYQEHLDDLERARYGRDPIDVPAREIGQLHQLPPPEMPQCIDIRQKEA